MVQPVVKPVIRHIPLLINPQIHLYKSVPVLASNVFRNFSCASQVGRNWQSV